MFDMVLNNVYVYLTTNYSVAKYMTRSSHRRCSVRKYILGNFAKFTGKHLCHSVFLIKLQASKLSTFLKTLGTGVSCQFCEISKNTFFTEHLATASVCVK